MERAAGKSKNETTSPHVWQRVCTNGLRHADFSVRNPALAAGNSDVPYRSSLRGG
jgi:hypothetical protein